MVTNIILRELSSCVFKFVFLDISMTLTQERNGFGFPNNDSLKQSRDDSSQIMQKSNKRKVAFKNQIFNISRSNETQLS